MSDQQDWSGNTPAIGATTDTGGLSMADSEKVVADRSARYGHPGENFRTIAELWTCLLDRLAGEPHRDSGEFAYEFRPEDVGLFMIAVKLAREANEHSADSLVDIEGYARCIRMIFGEAE